MPTKRLIKNTTRYSTAQNKHNDISGRTNPCGKCEHAKLINTGRVTTIPKNTQVTIRACLYSRFSAGLMTSRKSSSFDDSAAEEYHPLWEDRIYEGISSFDTCPHSAIGKQDPVCTFAALIRHRDPSCQSPQYEGHGLLSVSTFVVPAIL